MAGTAKAIDATKIHQGPGDLWIIAPAPDDTAQRLTLAADGTPDVAAHANCIHLGATMGGITTIIQEKLSPIEIDQADGPVLHIPVGVEMRIETELAQVNVDLLQHVLALGTYSTAAGYKQISIGGKLAITYLCVAAIAPKRSDPTKFIVSLLYKVLPQSGISILMGRDKPATNKVVFAGANDHTRSAGRQTGLIYETIA
ncbi:MAG TPA: hypothetical protein VN442_18505 [Bryobacteraceae bacterium]|nr:hypothetical protein [Bryobacteraceae bacterium]